MLYILSFNKEKKKQKHWILLNIIHINNINYTYN